jgi:hypothetical protein
MTTILDPSAPRIDQPRVVAPKPSLFAPALMLVIAAAVLTFLNIAAAVYTYRSTRNLVAIETRLGELKAFEDRVANRLDTMNNGIQSRLENLQSDVRGQIAEFQRDQTSALSPLPSNDIAEDVEIDPLGSIPESEPVATMAVEEELQLEEAVPAPRRDPGAKPVGKTSAYERIQSQDGKVYYRKVQ